MNYWDGLAWRGFCEPIRDHLTGAQHDYLSANPIAGSAAGWYQDPLNDGRIRYWDSRSWTDASGVVVPQQVRAERVTTLAALPGLDTVLTLGVVSVLSASSGWTAATKGNNALAEVLGRLRADAGALGANAIIGLQCSTFAAGGGIIKGLGGDAVGVLMMGTAVVTREAGP